MIGWLGKRRYVGRVACCRGQAVVQFVVTAPQARKSRVRIPVNSIIFFDDLFFPAQFDPVVDSAFKRNDYQGSSLGGKGGRCVGLTNFVTSTCRLPKDLGNITLLES
jgi:hypothetical protein